MAHIDYYFSTLSPYVYLAGTRLEANAAQHAEQEQQAFARLRQRLGDLPGRWISEGHVSPVRFPMAGNGTESLLRACRS